MPQLLDAREILNLLLARARELLAEALDADVDVDVNVRLSHQISPQWKVITFRLDVDEHSKLKAEDHDPSAVVVRLVKQDVEGSDGEVAIIPEDLILCLEEPFATEDDPRYGKVSAEKLHAQAYKIVTMLIEELQP